MTASTDRESPIAAVSRVLARETGNAPSNTLAMMLIEAVHETTPVPREVTIGMLSRILRSLGSEQALEEWSTRSAREVVRLLSKQRTIQQIASSRDEESIWYILEGTIAALLLRVCQGQDLSEPTGDRQAGDPGLILSRDQIYALGRRVQETTGSAWAGTDLVAHHAALVRTAHAGVELASCLRGAIAGCYEDDEDDAEVRLMLLDFLEFAGFESGREVDRG